MKKTLLLLALAASPLVAFAGEDTTAPSPRLGYGAHFGFNLGLLLGADCRLDENWGLYGRLKLGMTRTFERSFAVMPYALFPTYLSLGVNYTLRR
ncbi:hypothetical protein [uncultured Porphyromonas sp.]|uniref:hypothetical protein n=1 Tax=uncultured Porphyromonas sp. TaxID=159274 RepID=UPI0026171CB1|nr:hypothetical protein [uncultured Porphyromonas sp.]